MLKQASIILTLAVFTQFPGGCKYGDQYEVETLGEPLRQRLEREKRDFVQIEVLKIGTGPVAAWGRRISADVEIRQADGHFVFKGPVYDLVGFKGFPRDRLYGLEHLSSHQPGIRLGLNGMAVGGKRRITVDRKLVCEGIPDDAPPLAKCPVIGPSNHGPQYDVLKQRLIVEAILTQSCIPVRFIGFFLIFWTSKEIYCRTLDEPKPDPAAPIRRYYYARPSKA